MHTHLLQYNSFVNGWQLPLLCEKAGTIALVLPGLTAGWQAGSKNSAKFRNFLKL